MCFKFYLNVATLGVNLRWHLRYSYCMSWLTIFYLFKFIILFITYTIYLLLNFQSCLHIGHCCCGWEWSHFTIQCMWKQWEQAPQTKGQSSPGNLQSGQQLSNGMRHIPQLSSLATHRQVATPVQPEKKTNNLTFLLMSFAGIVIRLPLLIW